MRVPLCLTAFLICSIAFAGDASQSATTLRCEVVDADSGKPLPARVYVQSSDGQWLFAKSASPDGSAVIYDKQRAAKSVEKHTTVSAHPFLVDVPPGQVTIRVERGKEYLPAEQLVDIGRDPVTVRIELKRWINMAASGWYSGDTHVHRPLDELPNLLLAEDLNVGLPLTSWVTAAYMPPGSGGSKRAVDVEPKAIYVDSTHVIYPVNTEYEIFTVGHQRHTLGAVFALGHKNRFSIGVPPVRAFAEQARREGALLDLDKHSWAWSLMLVPVARVDLFELANNHCWRTEFAFRRWTIDTVPAYQRIQQDASGLTEWGWIDFGFQTYYALLNCGFRMRPSAGTASGVHPVPLGFGRVYVHVPEKFSYERWMARLAAGRSFVTTGPMLDIQVDGQSPGSTLARQSQEENVVHVTGLASSARPLRPIEIVVNGRVVDRLAATNDQTASGGYESPIDTKVTLDGSSWVVVRAFENRPDGRVRFAHSSPVHVDVAGKPLRPRRAEVEYLVRRMKEELERNRDVLRPDELDEYRQALTAYESLAADARDD